ncbi:hypothetical protein SCATT_p02650 (plasmid) [Streptantibioticus cattleyicolor NRRL 8057 = DSM 46488]|uniref:Uncharacterized protein n=1 Tax=Streptantibioticus cattleyicolor (strain ATCC 35852 / DSM 46488 / JCM 4925 / NBRC 14057 / NRRL 8057) TaxID=1003195 RepID=G8XF07_STREN|nr:hypothetical protein SCATT_p02650 [Streptantibioticus cattleyicolor NRRL 8057 = DSM 46488]
MVSFVFRRGRSYPADDGGHLRDGCRPVRGEQRFSAVL